ncbi:MAG TPA: hypothetical protein VGK22_07390 [Candidatus Angelobacter sp.]|jgi:hypothetical protein
MKNSPIGRKEFLDSGVFRRSLSKNDRLVESTCKNCRSFVAASVRPELLDFIEKLHFCILQSQFPGSPATSA